jgi:hypothetical protein
MKKMYFLLAVSLWFCQAGTAQNWDNPGEYMGYVGKTQRDVTQRYLSYVSAVAHGKKAKKVEKMRTKLLSDIDAARYKILDMPAFKGDRTYKDAAAAQFLLMYQVFNEDYAKIVNMEEIAEQSYDAMEAYLLAQEKAGDKLSEAGNKLEAMEKEFAKKNNVNLIDEETEMSRKAKQVSRVNEYHNKIYLLFFKSYKQEAYLMQALQEKNLNAVEQNRNSLAKYATEGLAVLDTMKGFDGDKSLVNACRNMLQFYKEETEKSMPLITDFILKSQNFTKMKTDFEGKGNHTKEEVDAFNKAVNEVNKGVGDYNKTNQQLNEKRSNLLNGWNDAMKVFMDTHIPNA